MKKIALAVRHSLSGKLKGYFFGILKILEEAKKEVFLCPLAKKLVKNSDQFSDLPRISDLQQSGCFSDLDIFIFFGGDGTLLRTVNIYAPEIFSIPLFGINAGNVGFFSSVLPQNIESGLEEVFAGNFSLDTRMILEGSVEKKSEEAVSEKKKTFYALNECVIHHNKIARIRKISTSISGKNLTTYNADGLIIATPTGSSAYNLAAGGPIVHVQMDAFILTPLAPTGFSQRPIVLPSEEILEFSVNGDMLLSLDGQSFFSVSQKSRIEIKKYTQKLTFLRLKSEGYYQTIREKLGWGK